jgi:cell division protein FtsI (penicillin-binding protein 3)
MNQKENVYTLRYVFAVVFFIVLLGLLLWRMIDLTVFDRQFLQGQGDARSLRTVTIPAFRGMISDRNGIPLAVSTPVQSVWANPHEFNLSAKQLQQLAQLLNVTTDYINKRIIASKAKEFVYIKRHIAPTLANKIKALNFPGVNLEQEFRRFYPDGENTAHIIGFTNIDDEGLEGLELAYDDWLAGVPGKKKVLKDRLGHIIDDIGLLKPPRNGRNLILSIDRRIQYLAYRELKQTVRKYKAKSGSVVVLDVKSGEILAMVNQPSYNPNSRLKSGDGRYRNRAVTDTFEPGSVIKPFSVASALESTKFTPKTLVDTRPSWMMVGKNAIRDGRNFGIINITEILQRSSNVGVSKMILANPPHQYIGLLRDFGFGQRTITGFPGESEGYITEVNDNQPFVLATMSFGYGLSVTVLQLAKAYLVFANNGKLLPVSFLHSDKPPEGKQVVSPKVASQVLTMLEAVVEKNGTGRNAQVAGFRIAGKTGTSRIATNSGYEESRHIASFAGIAPVSNPKLVIAIIINEPTEKSYYGGIVAAPLFARIMTGALRYLDTPPDDFNLHKIGAK